MTTETDPVLRMARAEARVQELERELARMQTSVRFEIGNLVIDGLQRPWTLLTSPARIGGLWRRVRLRRRRLAVAIAAEAGLPHGMEPAIDALRPAELAAIEDRLAGRGRSDPPRRGAAFAAVSGWFDALYALAAGPEALFTPPADISGLEHRPRPRTLLMTLARGRPTASNGYAARGHAQIQALQARGWTVIAGVWDLPEGTRTESDGVVYEGLGTDTPGTAPLEPRLAARARSVARMAARHGAGVILAASNHMVAAPAARAAAGLGVPWVYEVRGLWHVTRASVEPRFAGTPGEAMQSACEDHAIRAAALVFANGPVLTARAASVRGAEVIDLPNAAHPAPSAAPDTLAAARARWGGGDAPLFGYIGSLTSYEGLDLLVEASRRLEKDGVDHRIAIIGDGPDRARLERVIDVSGARRVRLFPPATPSDAKLAAQAMDVHVIARLDNPVNRMVAPLKPLEALAAGRALIVSTVAPLREYADAGCALGVAPGSADELAGAMRALAKDPEMRARMGAAGRAWVETERSWDRTAERMSAALEALSVSSGDGAPR